MASHEAILGPQILVTNPYDTCLNFILQVLTMAGLIKDRTVSHVESPESSVRQFGKQSEIREMKVTETENIYKTYSLPPNKIYAHLNDLDKGEIIQLQLIHSYCNNKY